MSDKPPREWEQWPFKGYPFINGMVSMLLIMTAASLVFLGILCLVLFTF
jgi:uncharacterized membrane protein